MEYYDDDDIILQSSTAALCKLLYFVHFTYIAYIPKQGKCMLKLLTIIL